MSQTKFADGKSPWIGTPWVRKEIDMHTKEVSFKPVEPLVVPKPKKAEKPIDVSKLVITNDPVQNRRIVGSKYDDVFNKLTFGHCIVCQPHEAARIGATLGKWLKERNRPGKIKCVSHYERDGKGRVWLLKD